MIRFDSMSPEVMQAMCTPMHEVLPSTATSQPPTGALYIGSLVAVQEPDLLRQHRITHLVQVLDVPWLPLSEKDGFHCYRIGIDDSVTVDLRPHLEAVCTYIDNALRSGRSVLVHCQQGVSRSAAIVIAFLIRNRGMSLDNALGYLKSRRPCIKPNSGFLHALKEWESSFRRPPITRRFTS